MSCVPKFVRHSPVSPAIAAGVIAVTSSPEKGEVARQAGAHEVVGTDGFREAVKELTGGRGVDVVFDHVGADTWKGSLRVLDWHGRYVTCGATTGGQVELNLVHLFYKAQSVLGSTMGSKGELLELLRHVEAGRLKPVVDRALPLSRAREAHRLIEAREVFGKVVLVPDRFSDSA